MDIAFSFDDTGSMSSVRRIVRQNLKELTRFLFGKIDDLRIAIIIHNDYCDAPRHIFTMDFTSDQKKIEKFIEQDSPCGVVNSWEFHLEHEAKYVLYKYLKSWKSMTCTFNRLR